MLPAEEVIVSAPPFELLKPCSLIKLLTVMLEPAEIEIAAPFEPSPMPAPSAVAVIEPT